MCDVNSRAPAPTRGGGHAHDIRQQGAQLMPLMPSPRTIASWNGKAGWRIWPCWAWLGHDAFVQHHFTGCSSCLCHWTNFFAAYPAAPWTNMLAVAPSLLALLPGKSRGCVWCLASFSAHADRYAAHWAWWCYSVPVIAGRGRPRAVLVTASCTVTDRMLHHGLAQADAAAPLTTAGTRWARSRTKSRTKRRAPVLHRPPMSDPSTSSFCRPPRVSSGYAASLQI